MYLPVCWRRVAVKLGCNASIDSGALSAKEEDLPRKVALE